MACSIVSYTDGAEIKRASVSPYQEEQVQAWIDANDGAEWRPSIFGWVFQPWMLVPPRGSR